MTKDAKYPKGRFELTAKQDPWLVLYVKMPATRTDVKIQEGRGKEGGGYL